MDFSFKFQFRNEASAILLFRLRGVKRMRKIKPIDPQTLSWVDRNYLKKQIDEATDEH
jgi:hypothetical protein